MSKKKRNDSLMGQIFDGPDSVMGRIFDGPESVMGRIFGDSSSAPRRPQIRIKLVPAALHRLNDGDTITYRAGGNDIHLTLEKEGQS